MIRTETILGLMRVRMPGFIKANMAKVLDAALAGQPTIVFRKGRLVIVKEYDPQTDSLSRLEAAFAKGGGLNREPTEAERKLVRAVSRRKCQPIQ